MLVRECCQLVSFIFLAPGGVAGLDEPLHFGFVIVAHSRVCFVSSLLLHCLGCWLVVAHWPLQ